MKLLNRKCDRREFLAEFKPPKPPPKNLKPADKWAVLDSILAGTKHGPGLTCSEIEQAMTSRLGGGTRRMSLCSELERRVVAGRLKRLGRGVKCDPYRYRWAV